MRACILQRLVIVESGFTAEYRLTDKGREALRTNKYVKVEKDMRGSVRITAPAWCRHKEMFRSYVTEEHLVTWLTNVQCSNCGASATDAGQTPEQSKQAANDALMKIEKVGAVSEVAAP